MSESAGPLMPKCGGCGIVLQSRWPVAVDGEIIYRRSGPEYGAGGWFCRKKYPHLHWRCAACGYEFTTLTAEINESIGEIESAK
jgi:hypothetical protein